MVDNNKPTPGSPNGGKPFPGPSNAPAPSGGVGGNTYSDKPVIAPNNDRKPSK